MDSACVHFFVRNLGLKSHRHASPTEPMTMYVKDFDRNGSDEQIVSVYNHGKSYPIVLRDDLIKALPYLKARYLNYKDYALQTVTDIFTPAELKGAIFKEARTLTTALARNNGDGSFTLIPLPLEAQIAPVYGMLAGDFAGDGQAELLLAGGRRGGQPHNGRREPRCCLLL